MLSRSKFQTQKFAVKLAKTILLRPSKRVGATIIALQGDLGVGKTTFVQGFMKALGVKHHITSPTFLIIRKYQLSEKFLNVYHLDLYRIHQAKELLDLGFKEIIKDPQNIVLIEWPERIKKLLPKNTIWINFEHGRNEKERIIKIK